MTKLLKVSVVNDEEEFERLQSDWNKLLRESSSDTIFLTWGWLQSWWKTYGDRKKLWILKVEQGTNLIGLVPLYKATFRKFGVLRYHGLYLIGDGSGIGDGSRDSDYLDIIAKTGNEEAVVCSVSEFLLQHHEQWDLLFLNDVLKLSVNLNLLRKFFRKTGYYWEEIDLPCAEVKLPTSWDEYLKCLRPGVRANILYLTRRVEKNYVVRFDCCSAQEDLGARLRSLFDLHSRRWKTKDQGGTFISPARRRFYYEMAQRFLSCGWLRFYSLSVNGDYVAHQFCFEYQKKVFVLQEGFAPEWTKQGVGNVLRGYVLRDCIKRGVEHYDFLGGVSPHKLSWGSQVKHSVRIRVGNTILKNSLYFIALYAWGQTKEFLKETIPSPVLSWLRQVRSVAHPHRSHLLVSDE